MLTQISLLVKRVAARGHWTSKWLLASVHAQMSQELAQIAKDSGAPVALAREILLRQVYQSAAVNQVYYGLILVGLRPACHVNLIAPIVPIKYVLTRIILRSGVGVSRAPLPIAIGPMLLR